MTLPSGRFVYVMRDGRATAVKIEAVQGDADHIIVDGLLTEGDRVITKGQSSLSNGQAVRVGSGKS